MIRSSSRVRRSFRQSLTDSTKAVERKALSTVFAWSTPVPPAQVASSEVNDPAGLGVSLVQNDPLFRLQRRIGLVPQQGFGTIRRALFWSLIAWTPVAASAWLTHRWTGSGESLIAHYGVHVRLLLAIPLLVLGETGAHRTTSRVLPHFVTSGLVPEHQIPRFRQAVINITALRDRGLPWVAMLAIIVAGSMVSDTISPPHEIQWSAGDASALHTFGVWWFLYVSRTIYLALLFAWLWRLVLLTLLMTRVARLGLALVPTHPDRAGGLGFLESLSDVFAPVVLASSAVLASRWAHDVLQHGVKLESYRSAIIVSVVLDVVLFTVPLLIFTGPLLRAKRRALLDYGALTARHGRLVHQRWVEGRTVADSVLDAPELGPLVDVGSVYAAVKSTRPAPIGRRSVAPLLVAAVLPMLLLLALKVPLTQIVVKLLAAVM